MAIDWEDVEKTYGKKYKDYKSLLKSKGAGKKVKYTKKMMQIVH